VALVVAAAALLSSPAFTRAASQDVGAALEQFRAQHGAQWSARFDGGTGRVEFLHGGAVELGPRPRSDAEWFARARQALAETAELHGVELAHLRDDRALFLPLGQVGSSDKWTVRFRQVVDGVPVEAGFVNVLFDARGRMLSIQTHALPQLGEFEVGPVLPLEQARELAIAAFASDVRLAPNYADVPQLVIVQLERGEVRQGVLAWRVEAHWEAADSEPVGFVYYLDARTGEVALRENAIHHADISGVVRTRATPGTAPDTGANPTTVQDLAYTTVSSNGVSVNTDASGAFTLPGVDAPAVVSVSYSGQFNSIVNEAGPEHALDFNVASPTGNVLLLNPAPSEHITSQANVAVGINQMRDWIRSVNPLDATADYVHQAFVNVNSSCNAFFNGASITFFIQAGGCVNTAYSTVIAHEDGHWLNVRYGTGNGGDGMGEGNADTFATYLYDDPIVGRNFCGNGCHIRNGLNLRQFCGDANPGCHGGVHANGEVWMGAAWKVRRNLGAALGDAAGDATADALFLAWMNAYNQTQIRSVIESQWLTLDDDDGFLSNGTPHFTALDNAFREQGFPGVALPPIVISAVSALPDLGAAAGPYEIDADVLATGSGGALSSVRLFHGTHASGFVSVPMTPVGGTTYRASIPDAGASARVRYYIEATTVQGALARLPTGGALDPLFFNVGPTQNLFDDNFELGLGWTVVNENLAAGAWTRGDPNGTRQFNNWAQPEDDNPAGVGYRCMFTEQGAIFALPELSDVDGGPTRLVSPSFDLTGSVAELRYSYWMYSSTNDDELVVELSNNDGASWNVVRTHSLSGSAWRESKLDILASFTPGANVRVRFSIADNGNNSVTEAAIDDVRIVALGGTGAPPPQVFCSTKINSLLCEPAIGSSGTPSATNAQPFWIGSSDLLNQKSGLMFYGYGVNSAPLQGGTLCCQPPVRRTATQSTGGLTGGADCSGALLYDMNERIRSGIDPALAPGALVAAQFYYRDPQDNFGIGLTNAVQFQIAP
jgi:hypothetical protein